MIDREEEFDDFASVGDDKLYDLSDHLRYPIGAFRKANLCALLRPLERRSHDSSRESPAKIVVVQLA
jgi:hypothetical protein